MQATALSRAKSALPAQEAEDNLHQLFETLRAGEEAERRYLFGQCLPGDVGLLRAAGLDACLTAQPKSLVNSDEKSRLKQVAEQLERAGSIKDFETSEQSLQSVRTRNAKELPKLEKSRAELLRQLQALDEQVSSFKREESDAHSIHQPRVDARSRVMSDSLLPQVIVEELKLYRLPANAHLVDRVKELKTEITELRSDSAIDPTVSTLNGDERVQNIKRNPTHRGYDFWKTRNYSKAEWALYRAWCLDRVKLRGDELRATETQIDEADGSYVTLLKSYYVDQIS